MSERRKAHPKDPSQQRKRLRSTGRMRSVKTATPPPQSDLFQAMHPDEGAGAELEGLRAEIMNLKRLQEVIHFLGGAPDLLTLRTELLDLALSLSGLKRGMLALPTSSDDDGSRRFKVKVKRGFEDPKLKGTPEVQVLRRILNEGLESREGLVEGNLRNDGILGHAAGKGRKLRLGAVACLPLLANGHILGAMILDDPERITPFSAAEDHLLRSFARHAAVALQRVAQQSKLRRQAARLQRRNERLEAELEHSSRRQQKLERQNEDQSERLAKLASDIGTVKKQPDRAGKELRRILAKEYPKAKRAFTRRYLAEALRRCEGDLLRVSTETGLPLARLIGLIDFLDLNGEARPSCHD